MKKILCSVFLIFLFCASVSTVSAQDEFVNASGLQISPVRLDWRLEDGERRRGTINVKNYSDKERNVSISVENFFVSPDSEHTNLFGGNSDHPRHAFNVIDWFEIPEDFTLSPGESQDVSFFVSIPDNQPTNGYYGSVLFQTTNRDGDVDEKKEGTEIGVNYRVGAIVTLAVQGEGEPFFEGMINNFESTEQIYWDNPIHLKFSFKNTGNLHYRQEGEIVLDRFGKKYSTAKLESHVMYPDAVREMSEEIQFGMWDFGKYTAHLHVDVENGDVTISDKLVSFYVVPWRGLAIVCGGICFVLLVFRVLPRYVSITWKKNKK